MNELRFFSGVTGQPLTATLASGLTLINNIPLAESSPGYYVGSVPANTARGDYDCFAVNQAGEVVSVGQLYWLGDRELDPMNLDDLHLIHGLRQGAPLSVTTTQRDAGSITQSITQSGDRVTIARG